MFDVTRYEPPYTYATSCRTGETYRASWEITIQRRDGSSYRWTKFCGREPTLYAVIETTDEERRVIRARIGAVTKHPPKATALGVFQISAQEID